MSRRQQAPEHDWRGMPADPDLELDLEYEIDDWKVIRTQKDDTSHLMFLPEDEGMLKEDAFIVAEKSAVCDVKDFS